jgi:putative colanic acid biosynthesis glycosyltransferase WcaI
VKIHVWGINYSPEVTGIGPYNVALCEDLARRGHSVRMITTFCYYPAWQKLPSERRVLFRTDSMDGVTVHRCWHYVPKTVTTVRRILHELSFVTTSFFRQLVLPPPDLMVLVSPPLLLGAAGWLLCLLKSSRFVFHVQDLQPDAAAGLGMLKPGLLLRLLRALETFAYRKASRVSGITPGFLRAFEEKKIPRRKLIYFPNGTEIPDFWRLPEKGKFRAAHRFAADERLVVYSGNIGRKQGLDLILEAAALVRNPKIRFIICGDGAHRGALERHSANLSLKNVLFLPLMPELRFRELMIDADLCVISQEAGSGRCFFPSKLLKALAFSRPIFAVAEKSSELADAVHEGGFGMVVPPEDPSRIAWELEASLQDTEKLRGCSRAGFKFVKRFEESALLQEFAKELAALHAEAR